MRSRVDLHCAMQQIEGLPGGMGVRCKYERKGSHRQSVDVEIFRPLAPSLLDFGAPDARQDRLDDAFRYLVLQAEQIAYLAVVAAAPDLSARRRVEETNDDP